MFLFRMYPLAFLLQMYCLYHAYKNGSDRKWFFIIFFLPLLGSLFYLYDHFYSKEKLENIQENLKSLANDNYEVEKLLIQSRYSDTISNKIKLAEEFFKRKQYDQAAALFESCLTGFNENNISVIGKLMKVSYQLENYEKVVQLGERLQRESVFEKSDERIIYAWSLYKLGQVQQAQVHFQSCDIQFSNYPHRLEYANFLKATGQDEQLKDLLARMQDEMEHMEPREKKMKRPLLREVNSRLQQLN